VAPAPTYCSMSAKQSATTPLPLVDWSQAGLQPRPRRPFGARLAFGTKWTRALVGGLLIWFSARVIVTSIAIASHSVSSGREAFFERSTWFISLFSHWDSKYFAAIAAHGYFAPGSNPDILAFLPGYPLAARLIAGFWGPDPTANQIAIAMWVVPFIASAVASVLLWRLVETDYGPRVAAAATVLLAFGPYSLFLQASYSESLFLAFAIAAWWAVRTDRWVIGGVLAAVASATRINGLFLVLALGVLFIVQRRTTGRPFLRQVVGLIALGLSGIAAYFAYLFAATGKIFAWCDAQGAGWHRSLNWPWVTFARTADEALNGANFDHRFQSSLDIAFAVVAVVAVLVMVRKRHWAEAVFVAATAGPLLTSNTYLSVARNTLVLFPLVILLASALENARWRWLYWAGLAVGVVILIINVNSFTLGGWTG
jgi:Mannosyltransferase (PIG-V)